MSVVDFSLRVTSTDTTGVTDNYEPGPIRFPRGAVKKETVTLTALSFTALDPPTSTKAVLIELQDAISLSLKSVTGDGAGLTIAPAANPVTCPVFLPLGATPSLGILNSDDADQEVTVWWW